MIQSLATVSGVSSGDKVGKSVLRRYSIDDIPESETVIDGSSSMIRSSNMNEICSRITSNNDNWDAVCIIFSDESPSRFDEFSKEESIHVSAKTTLFCFQYAILIA